MSEAAPSRLDDYLDVFVSPTALFTRRSDGKFGQALLVLVVLSAILFFATKTAMAPIMDAEFAKGMAGAMKANPNMTPEQVESAKRIGATFAPIAILVFVTLAPFILGGVIFLVTRLVGAAVGYAQGATIATFALFPRLVESIVGAVQALLMDESRLTSRLSVSLGLGRLMDPATNPYVLALAGRVDLFSIWVTALIAIGIKVMGKTTTAQAVGAAVIVWFVGAIPLLFQAMRQG
ncbi:MAG TPA: YIP1 family protein [Gemmatimonadales bacterium]|nr:YIP1 family protein [Gemmatimonadales bacterium]